MTISTTCHLYWANLQNLVTEADVDRASCDSSLTTCIITSSHGVTLAATCDSQLHLSDTTNTNYASYFCVCGSKALTVPSIVDCADKCYALDAHLTCDTLTLSTGFTAGSPVDSILADQCVPYRCDSSGTKCTTDGAFLTLCDNQQHDSDGDTSTKSYVCNCDGPATIPSLYRVNGQSTGTACGGSSAAAGSSGVASVSSAASVASVASVATVSSVVHSSTTTTPALSTTSPSSAATSSPSTGIGSALAVQPEFGLLMLILMFLRF